MITALLCECIHTYELLTPHTALLHFSRDAHHQSLLCFHTHCTSAALTSKMRTALLVSAITPMSFWHLTQLYCISAEMHTTKAYWFFTPTALHQCCIVKQDDNSLALWVHSHLRAFDTSHSSIAFQQRWTPPKPVVLSHPLYQCCSLKQDENSLACQCIHTYELLTPHTALSHFSRDAHQQSLLCFHTRCTSAAL